MKRVSANQLERGSESLFHHLFVRYGTGSNVVAPIMRWKYWNAFAWTTIVIGTLGWAVAIIAWNF